uniref:Minor glycoprotein n=1 Tax=Kibale red colobus virus 1 TaxID=1885929 RepID=X2D5B3_9NIDO|nr:minor glycoprotein [Kibale red colobus virus 1]
MGHLLFGVVAPILAFSVGAWSEPNLRCMPCQAHNHTHLMSQFQKVYSRDSSKTGGFFTPQPEASIYLMGLDCTDETVFGNIQSYTGSVTGNLTDLDYAFNFLALMNCLTQSIKLAARGYHVSFQLSNHLWNENDIQDSDIVKDNGTLLLLCTNHTVDLIKHTDLTGFWFFHPGALRWGTVFCCCLAVLRALWAR